MENNDITILSVRQPWAWLILQGLKPIENRTWSTPYRGPLQLHAGKSFDFGYAERLGQYPLTAECAKLVEDHFGILPGGKITKATDEFGAVVGKCILAAVFDPSAALRQGFSEWADPGAYHWWMTCAAPMKPVPMTGQLRLFKRKAEVPE